MSLHDERIRDEVRRQAEAVARPLGVEVVEVVFHRAGQHSRIRVDIDRPGTPGVTLEDCQRVTEGLSPALDATGLMEFRYHLEVSSPGLERPIRTDDDVRRNVGRRVVVETAPGEGPRRVRGVLLGSEEGALRVAVDGGGEVRIPRQHVVTAHQEVELGGSDRTGSRGRERGSRMV